MKFSHQLKEHKILQNPLNVAWRYVRDPWWLALIGLVFVISQFAEPMPDFDRVWQKRPFGTIMELICRPTWTRFNFEHRDLGGRPIWAYFGLWLFFLIGTFAVDFAIHRLFAFVRRITRRIGSLNALLTSRLENRHIIVFSRWLARIGVILMGSMWFGVAPQFQLFLKGLLKISFGCYATWWVIQIAHASIHRWKSSYGEKNDLETDQLFYILRNISNAAIIIIMSVLIAGNLGYDVSSIVASLGLGAVAVGLGAQDTFANLFGALTVFIDRPFTVGDMVRIEGIEGRVEKIGLRSTRIRNGEGFIVTLPNKLANSAYITNMQKKN